MSWNRERSKKEQSTQKAENCRNYRKLTFYAVLGAVGLLGVGWGVKGFIGNRTKSEKTLEVEKKTPLKKKSTPPAQDAANMTTIPTNTAKLVPPKIKPDTLLSSVTSSTGRIVERFRMPDGRTYKVRRWAKPPLFRHTTDNILSMLLTQHGSGPIPPIPYTENMDKEFLESLKDPIIIDKNAAPEIQERQRIVREARMEVKALMDQGLSFREIAAEHETLVNRNAATRAEALAELKKERDKGDSEGTQKFLDEINETLEDMGVDPISMPTRPIH